MGLLLDSLGSVDFLRSCDRDAVVRFMVLGRSADYAKGHVFWREGMPSQGVVIPVSGEAKSTTRGTDGREFIDCFTGPSECLGLETALDGLKHPTNAEVLRAGEFFTIRLEAFMTFLREHPEIRDTITEMLGRRLRRNLREREDIALRPVSERVAHFLVANACVRQSDGAKVLVEATQSEMAARLGTVREVVARVFASFSREGIIERTRDGIFVRDWDALRAQAGMEPEEHADPEAPTTYGPSSRTRTARFFLPLAEQRARRGRQRTRNCAEHVDDLEECRRKGCPGADA